METKQKECEICGVWFTPSRSSQKYCHECGKDPTKAWRDLHKHMQYSMARVGTARPVSKTEVSTSFLHGRCREEVRDMFDWMYATNISGLWWMWWLH